MTDEKPNGAAAQRPDEQWPSVGLAYAFVQPSYEWMQRRLDVMEARLQAAQTLLVSITLAVPVFGQMVLQKPVFTSGWFIAAITCFFAAVGATLCGRIGGVIKLPDPTKLHDLVGYSEWEFRKTLVYRAGEDMASNRALVDWKWKTMIAAVCLAAIEVFCFALWLRGVT
jgi:hypothetical protein